MASLGAKRRTNPENAVIIWPRLIFLSAILALLFNLLDRFRYLKLGLTVVLAYVGVKMLISHHLNVPVYLSLMVILLSLAASILASWLADKTGRS